jgi:hypothetical protein
MTITKFMMSTVVVTLVVSSTLITLTFPTVEYSVSWVLSRVLLGLLMLTLGSIQGLLITCRYPLGNKRHAAGVLCYATAIMVAIGLMILDLGTSYDPAAMWLAIFASWVLTVAGIYLNID